MFYILSILLTGLKGIPAKNNKNMAAVICCAECNEQVGFIGDNFCSSCGNQLDTETNILKHYFYQGYEYNTILDFISKYHGISMCLRTLKNRFQQLGLCRKDTDFNEEEVRARIQSEIDGPGCMGGYRTMWHTLRSEGYMVPRGKVEHLLKELDPEGCEFRRARRLRRRAYVNQGPNFCWHIDGYDKLKPFGFPIHGCIDGYSRKMLWLKVSRSNNNPHVILKMNLDTVRKYGGCPIKVRTDYGTENGLVAAAQYYFTDNEGAHIYGTSQHNQRIEGWWSFFRRNRASWWINFFKDLSDQGSLTTGNDLEMECLWFCFCKLIQQDLDDIRHRWNTHYIRRSRHDTIPGRPNELFYLPESRQAHNFLQPVDEHQLQHLNEEYAETEVEINEYEEYFNYLMTECSLTTPNNWRECLHLYNELRHYGHGHGEN
jgi:hypothetical protein